MVGDAEHSVADPQRRAVLVAVGDDQLLTEVRGVLHNSGFIVVAEARDAPGAIEAARRTQPDMCLFATDLAGGGATAAARQITSEVPAARIALIAPSVALEQALEAVQAGADAYLEQRTVNDWLVPALRTISRGGIALPPIVTARVVRDWRAAREPATSGIRRTRTQRRMRDLRTSFVEQMRYYGVLDIQPPPNDVPSVREPATAGSAAPVTAKRAETPVVVDAPITAKPPDAPIAVETVPEKHAADELASVPVARQAEKPVEHEPDGARLLYPLSWMRQFFRGLVSGMSVGEASFAARELLKRSG